MNRLGGYEHGKEALNITNAAPCLAGKSVAKRTAGKLLTVH